MAVYTEDNPTYQFFQVRNHSVTLAVKAAHNAHIALSSKPEDSTPLIEVFLGGWENSKSAIRFNKEKPDKSEAPTPTLLSGEEAKTFVLRWTDNGKVDVYMEGASEPFLSWLNEEQHFEIRYIGIRTAWGATGDWKIDGVREVHTEDNFEYQWFPAHNALVDLSVKAKNDAHIALAGGAEAGNPMYEIFLGGWDNTKCAIRHNQEKPDVAMADGSVSAENFQRFWVKLNHGGIQVGRGGESEPFLSWDNPEPFVVSHFGIRTAWGSDGNWLLHDVDVGDVEGRPKRDAEDVQWVQASNGEVPEGALVGGEDNGNPLFVVRAVHEDATLPGKLLAEHGVAYVPWGGEEHGKEIYEVLVISPDAVAWVDATGTDVPPNAIQGGTSEDGEALYVGRVTHEGLPTVGKFHPSHGKVYISYGGAEIGYEEFQVLTKL